jgi:hypothetical protein
MKNKTYEVFIPVCQYEVFEVDAPNIEIVKQAIRDNRLMELKNYGQVYGIANASWSKKIKVKGRNTKFHIVYPNRDIT